MSISVTKKLVDLPPEAYAAAAVLAREAGEQMLQRLEWVTMQPKVILDVGCGTGYCAGLLQERYPSAEVVALDISHPMLEFAKAQGSAASLICGDTNFLPLRNHSVDLIFANLILPWNNNVEKLLQEWQRVLRPDGLLVFTSLGPDTLQVWGTLFNDKFLPDRVDMHELGDALTRGRFADPVLDAEYFTLAYRQSSDLLRELQATGMLATDFEADTVAMEQWRNSEGFLPAVYEVVFGHAWSPSVTAEFTADEMGTVRIPLAHLRGRR